MAGRFLHAVSMRVTLEQYEADLKKPLEELGYHWMPMSMNYGNSDGILGTNIDRTDYHLGWLLERRKDGGDRYYIDHYNPKLFLALAGQTHEGSKGCWYSWQGSSDDHFTQGELYECIQFEDAYQNKLMFKGKHGHNLWLNTANHGLQKAARIVLITHFTKPENMEITQRRVIGYKAPMNLFQGAIMKGDVFTIGIDGKNYTRTLGDFTLPAEIVEVWEKVYETQQITRDISHSGGSTNIYITHEGIWHQTGSIRQYINPDSLKGIVRVIDCPYKLDHDEKQAYDVKIATVDIGCKKGIKVEDIRKIWATYVQLVAEHNALTGKE
jgi:hypothetical protein